MARDDGIRIARYCEEDVMKKIDWKCPKCQAPANKCGRGTCKDAFGQCMGFICDCDIDTAPEHGQVASDPCHEANCYHCDWGGTFPIMSSVTKGWPTWAKQALKEGWAPPLNWSPKVAKKKKS